MVNVNDVKQFDLLTKEEQAQLVEWCRNLEQSKAINRHHTSYSLKHLFQYGGGWYCTNGAFKQAMLLAGFEYKPCESGINWRFNVSQKSVAAVRQRRGA